MIPFLFLGFFGFYLATLSGTLPAYRDSGDMINAVATLGIAHPPGYPLFILFGKLFTTFLPFANIAYRTNAFSAACAAGALAILFWGLRRRTNTGIALVTAICLGVTPAILSLARVSEMYAMAMAMGAGIMACRLIDTPRSLLLGSFLLGLGFGVHPTLIFLAPLFVTFRKEAFGRLVFFLLGFSVVFYLLVRSWADPLQNWGNPTTLGELWKMITRSNYGGLKLHPMESQFVWTPEGVWTQAAYFLKSFRGQWGVTGLFVGSIGLIVSLRNKEWRPLGAGLFCSWLIAGPLFFVLSNLPIQNTTTGPILEPYFVLVNVLWGVWVAYGVVFILSFRRKPESSGVNAAGPRLTTRRGDVLAILVVVVAIPLYQAFPSFRSYRDHFYAYDLGRNMLRTLPPRAVLYDPDDPICFTLRGLQLLENRRQDVVLLNFFRTLWGYKQLVRRYPDLLPRGQVQNAQELDRLFWSDAIKRRPFYADLPAKVTPPRTFQVQGIVYPIETSAGLPPTRQGLEQAERWFEFYVWRGSWRTGDHPDFFTRQVLNYRSAAYSNLGIKYAERRDWNAARESYRRSLAMDRGMHVAYNNLGVAFYEEGRYDQAAENFLLALRFDPGNPGYTRNLEMIRKGSRD